MSNAYPLYWRQLLNVAQHVKEDFSNLSFLSSMFTFNLAPFRHFTAFITVVFTLFSGTIFLAYDTDYVGSSTYLLRSFPVRGGNALTSKSLTSPACFYLNCV